MTLLVQTCSDTKHEVDGAVPAIELYDGYFYRIIGKARREDAIHQGVELCILSAEHGIIDPDDEIEWYDRRMTPSRARELREEVVNAVAQRATGHGRVVVNAGRDYLPALEGLDERVEADVCRVEGSGIGAKGSVLKEVLRGGSEAVERDKVLVEF